ncbi:MAG TPA: adenylate/guanylate cyclase domain-containing protein [Gaiellaceae bacterium]|nr:adenylate/guanylate cyclase domain-containing protein [Gaiellaceae bacterium]
MWFADIVGYTSMSETNEGEAVRLAHAFQRAARDVVGGFGGRVVKSLGDGALAEFPSTEMAVRSAHAMLAAFDRAAAEAGLTTEGLRIGVHVGDIAVSDDGDLYGDGVNVASRLQSAARPGEVWVSEDVWRQLRRRPELAFESRGEHELKGIGQPLQAHSVRVLDEEEWTAPAERPGRSEATAPAGLRRPVVIAGAVLTLLAALLVAALVTRDRAGLVPGDAIAESAAPGVVVLPFTVNDPELARWKEGMVDLLSTNLDGAGGLRAIDSRTVLARWRERVPEDGVADLTTALDIARRAGGRYGLVGSAVSSGASMRLAAELYDLESGATLGSPQVEGSPDSIFGLVDRLSIEVLALILEQDADAPRVDLASVTTSSLPALKSYLEAEELARRGDFPSAIPAYEEAVAADSTFALAHVRLADAYGWDAGITPQVLAEYAAAERHSARLPEREAALLEVSLAYANARAGATRLAEQVSERYPDDPGAWYLLGETYFHLPYQSLPSFEKQREPFARAMRLDPNYLPAEIHLVDLAFATADEAAADSLMRDFGPRTQGSAYGRGYAVAHRLAFGDSATSAAATAGLDTLSFDVLRRIPPLLRHPQFFDQQRAVVRETRSRPEFQQFAHVADFFYGLALLQWGDLEAFRETIGSGELFAIAEQVAMTTAWFSEMPLPDALYDGYFGLAPDQSSGPRLVAVGARALQRGDRAAYEAATGRLRAGAEQLLAAGDSTTARQIQGSIRLLAAREAMLRNRSDEALAELEALYAESGAQPAGIWAAQILDDRGDEERAIRYLEQIGPNPIVGLWLGSLYEEVGRREDALDAYGWVVLAWEDADPALRDRVQLARQALARLEGLQRD